MAAENDDAYRKLICAVLNKANDDAIKGEYERDRAWLNSPDCATLCEMIDISQPYFKEQVLKKIKEHDRRKGKRR